MSRVTVTAHAVDRAKERKHFAHLEWSELTRMIELEVALAISERRIANHKPPWTRLVTASEVRNHRLSTKHLQCDPGSFFVWNAAETLGWIVKRERGATVVVTSLHRVRSQESCAA